MNEEIILRGEVMYNEKFPPRDAKKGYVAKITGRTKGPMKFEREFFGHDEGLYERQRGDKKGGYTRWCHVILSHPEHGLIKSVDCESDAPKIAKMLDDGHSIEDIVEIVDFEATSACRSKESADRFAKTDQ